MKNEEARTIAIDDAVYKLADLNALSPTKRKEYSDLAKRIGELYALRMNLTAEQGSELTYSINELTRRAVPDIGSALSQLTVLQKFAILNVAWPSTVTDRAYNPPAWLN